MTMFHYKNTTHSPVTLETHLFRLSVSENLSRILILTPAVRTMESSTPSESGFRLQSLNDMAEPNGEWAQIPQALLDEFKMVYEERSAFIEQSMKKILDILPEVLRKANVQFHEPIASRMKKRNSAINKVKTQWETRMKRAKYKEEFAKLTTDWETYWLNDHGPFPDVRAMFSSLHDIGGIRIMIYFPNDVDKIENCLKSHADIDFVRRTARGRDMAKDEHDLKNFLLRSKNLAAEERISPNFPGYLGDHFHVKPRRTEEEGELDFHIEIQVPTVVIGHKWSIV
jgi:ppGpp synthetase/RelA/SpoT-type nucleotidyltranferase